MIREYVFVSCDIIAHSAEASIERQRHNVSMINEIVAKKLHASTGRGAIWASGGDGGHVAFPTTGPLRSAVELILDLRKWSVQAGVNLRITANHGMSESIKGADGRAQLVGPGINVAGRLLPFGDQSRIIVTGQFRRLLNNCCPSTVRFHDDRQLQLANLPDEQVCLLSVAGQFESIWNTPVFPSDRFLLFKAWETQQVFEVVFRAKRLLEINPEDDSAKDILRALALKKLRPQTPCGFIYDLLLDEQFGIEMVRASTLIERQRGHLICEHEDQGTTMFFLLRGQVGIYFPRETHSTPGYSPPPDLVMSPGELLGELAFALRRPRTATVRCLEDSALLAFSSGELLNTIRHSTTALHLEEDLNRNLLFRIVENIWNTARIFRGYVPAPSLSQLSSPWVTLLNYTQLESLQFGNRLIDFTERDTTFEGVCILVSGTMEEDGSSEVLDGRHYPVLVAHFPGELIHHVRVCRLRDNVKLVRIAKQGLLELGADSYAEILERIRKSIPHTSRNTFDVFLSYNSHCKQSVRELKQAMTAAGLTAWFDEDELRPGMPWQQLLEIGIISSRSVAVLVGKDGIGPWEREEMQAALRLAVKDGRPIIPVLLPGAPKEPDVPMFLGNRTWVDMRNGFKAGVIKKLMWGITGKKTC